MLSFSEAAVISTMLQGILYGFSLAMFILAGWILLRGRTRRINWGMLSAGFGLLVLSTAEMAVNIARMYEGFITNGPRNPGGPEGYFSNISQTTFIVESVLYNMQTLILDAVVIYRAYVVWKTIFIVILPIIAWLGLVAVSIGLNHALATANAHKGDIFVMDSGRWITTLYAMTLATNLSSSLLLAYKIWSISRRSVQYRSNNIYGPVIRTIIESGAIYSVTITAALILFVVKSPGVYVVLDMISPIISIVFNILIIRIGIASYCPHLSPTPSDGNTRPRGVNLARGIRRQTNSPHAMRNMKLENFQANEDEVEDYHSFSIDDSLPSTSTADREGFHPGS